MDINNNHEADNDQSRSFLILFYIACLHSLLSMLFIHPKSELRWALAVASGLAVLYFFWRRRDWARIVVSLTAIIDFIIDIPILISGQPFMKTVSGIHLALAVALLVGLNLQQTRKVFRRSGAATQGQS